ncbi:type II secretion system protein GspM [Pseudomonas sp. dw_358]|uniref:type II secretion system protein GspM n=1 Tax=Pseudomonas sp. dw_358 TaxID=2720083 RepID=UPI001BD413A0|nr:type II secretion system protein GspM [Pseudomonas sp. dw_358]
MRRALTVNERRIAALALLALLLWTGWYVLIDSWFATPMAALDEQAQLLQSQHQRYARVLEQGPALRASLDQARQDPDSRASLLAGEDANAAAAQLMQYAVDRVKAQALVGPGCVVTQRMPMVPEQDATVPYRQVKVSLTLECATEPLMRLLHDFEYSQPTLFVEDLSVHRPTTAASSGGPGRLKVQLLLRGYLAAAREPQA